MSEREVKASTIVDKAVAERLRRARRDLNFSQEKLAKKTGLSFQQIQKYEKGVNRVSAGRLHELAQLLDKPVTWFYEDIEIDQEITQTEVEDPNYAACLALIREMKGSDKLGLVREFLSMANASN